MEEYLDNNRGARSYNGITSKSQNQSKNGSPVENLDQSSTTNTTIPSNPATTTANPIMSP